MKRSRSHSNDEELFSPRKKIKTIRTEEVLEDIEEDPDYNPSNSGEDISVTLSGSIDPENSEDRAFIDVDGDGLVDGDWLCSPASILIKLLDTEQTSEDFVKEMEDREKKRRELLKIRWGELKPLLQRTQTKCDLFEADCEYHFNPAAEDKCPDTYICKQCLAELNKHH